MYERTKLTHVAIRFLGKVYSLPAPARHHDVIRLICQEANVAHVDAHDDDQGFLDEKGTYLTRKQALVSADLLGQLKPGTVVRCSQLFSEDVW
jgi:hypothetical protein